MSINLYIVRHGKINTDEKNKREYLHLSDAGKAFGEFLDKHFTAIYFDHIFYQSTDIKTTDPYNRCRATIQGLKGVKSEFNNPQLSKVFEELNGEESGMQNILICFRAEAYNVISNIISPASEEEFNKDYHRIFHYRFNKNNYQFIDKMTAE
ncbi:MAG: hypothetical protein ABI666_02505 [Ferruginibacter sp.]